MHYQDDLDDIPDAISDYQTSLAMNSLQSADLPAGTRQHFGERRRCPSQLTALLPACSRCGCDLAICCEKAIPATAIELYQEVLQIDPQRLGVNTLIAETYVIEAQQSDRSADTAAGVCQRRDCVPGGTGAFTGDAAKHRAHGRTRRTIRRCIGSWLRFTKRLGQNSLAVSELQSYLLATQWHSDVYPWRIALARQPNPNVGAAEIVSRISRAVVEGIQCPIVFRALSRRWASAVAAVFLLTEANAAVRRRPKPPAESKPSENIGAAWDSLLQRHDSPERAETPR